MFKSRKLIERFRLIKQIRQELEQCHIFLIAPGGYGKTVFLQQLVAHRPHTYYFSLHFDDLDQAVLEAKLTPFLAQKNTIILDDCHLLMAKTSIVDWLTEQLSIWGIRWIIAGRSIPQEFERLIVKGKAVQWNEKRIAFSLGESQTLLSDKTSAEVVAGWHERLEGWSLGLGLLQQLDRVEREMDTALVASTTQLFNYLAESVFGELPASLQHFLTISVVPLRFNDDLISYLYNGKEDVRAIRAEAQQRNLFLYRDEAAGWFRYHDLIRQFLLEQQSNQIALSQKVADWLIAHGKVGEAITQLISFRQFDEAGAKIHDLPDSFIWDNGAYFLYQHWIDALPDEILRQYPTLLMRLGLFITFMPNMVTEAGEAIQRGIQLAVEADDLPAYYFGRMAYNIYCVNIMKIDDSVANDIQSLLKDPALPQKQRMDGNGLSVIVFGFLGRFQEAEMAARKAIALAEKIGKAHRVWNFRRLLMADVWEPMGKIAEATNLHHELTTYYADLPSWNSHILIDSLPLWRNSGHWDLVREKLEALNQLLPTLNSEETHILRWLPYNQAIYAVHQKDWEVVKSNLAEFRRHQDQPEKQIWVAHLEGLLALGEGCYEDVLGMWEGWLTDEVTSEYERSLLALDYSMVQVLAMVAGEMPASPPQSLTKNFIKWRCRLELVRLRKILTIYCYLTDSPRWRRHMHAAIFASTHYPMYDKMLTARDPELNVHFWKILWQEGMFSERVEFALRHLGQCEPLLPLLTHENDLVQVNTARLLVTLGDEQALPAFSRAIKQTKDKSVKTVLQAALTQLESQPPPLLCVNLMGDFSLRRGDEQVESWHRPVVRQLFQYLALNAGISLPRDRILEDLWTDLPPKKAYDSFRSVLSRLNKTLEPFIRRNGPNRYLQMVGENVMFGNVGILHLDTHHFETIIHQTLAQRDMAKMPQLEPEFLLTLENYAPLLPEHPYAEWLLEPRQRLHELYIEGCLYAGQLFLMQAKPENSIKWTRQALNEAPWLEEAYQSLMRAYARQGQRSLALRTYDEAYANLKRELSIEPSQLTQWLVERLRAGESI